MGRRGVYANNRWQNLTAMAQGQRTLPRSMLSPRPSPPAAPAVVAAEHGRRRRRCIADAQGRAAGPTGARVAVRAAGPAAHGTAVEGQRHQQVEQQLIRAVRCAPHRLCKPGALPALLGQPKPDVVQPKHADIY